MVIFLKRGPEREDIIKTISLLKREKKLIFKKIAELLSLPRRKRITLNLFQLNSKINNFIKGKSERENVIFVVPGKVLGGGVLKQNKQKIVIAALSFSPSAKKEIKDSGGECINFEELIKRKEINEKTKIVLIR